MAHLLTLSSCFLSLLSALFSSLSGEQEASLADKAVFEEVHSQMGMVYRFATVTSVEVLKQTKYTSGSTVLVHKPVRAAQMRG